VKERFATETLVDAGTLIHHIEMTRFPVPRDAFYQRVGDFAGLVRAADLIGQMADPQYIQKLSKLFMEFTETGEAERLGYDNPGALRADYPAFFFERVRPYISEGLRFLRKTQEGQLWIANLFSHVYSEQQSEPSCGPDAGSATIRAATSDAAGDRVGPQIAVSNSWRPAFRNAPRPQDGQQRPRIASSTSFCRRRGNRNTYRAKARLPTRRRQHQRQNRGSHSSNPHFKRELYFACSPRIMPNRRTAPPRTRQMRGRPETASRAPFSSGTISALAAVANKRLGPDRADAGAVLCRRRPSMLRRWPLPKPSS
jgi:hypothetical protein